MSARSALLALCGLLLAGSRLATGRPFERPPGGLLGLTFPVVKSGDEQQQQQQQAVASDTPAAHLDEGLKRALLLRELELDGSSSEQAHQLSNKELLRRVRLNQLLDAISASIPASPSAPGTSGTGSNGGGGGGGVSANGLSASSALLAPIYRNSRTYPSREVAPSERGYHLRLAPVPGEYAPANGAQQWKSAAGLVEAHAAGSAIPKSRQSGILGIVWPSERPVGPISATPPFYSNPASSAHRPVAQQQPASAKLQQQEAALPNVYGANQQHGRSIQLQAQPQQQQQQQRPQHHRSGTEEVPMHTPNHSLGQSDYEWKRVESSRWNNLRGMWGKRSALRDDESLAQKYKELLESDREPRRPAPAEDEGVEEAAGQEGAENSEPIGGDGPRK